LSNENGLQVDKVYRFAADSYAIGLDVQIANNGDQPLKDSLVVALRISSRIHKKSQAFEGPSTLVNRSLEQIPIDEIEKKGNLNVRWLGAAGVALFRYQRDPSPRTGR